MIEQLTKEQEKLMYQTRDEWLGYLFENRLELDKEKAETGVKWLYKLCGLKEPEVSFVSSPYAAQVEVNKRAGNKEMQAYEFSTYGNVWDYGWLSFYSFFEKIGVFDNEDFTKYKDMILSGIYDMIQMDTLCVVCKMPDSIIRDDNNRLHSIDGYAIEWDDGYGQHYIHGRFVDKKLFEKCAKGKVTAWALIAMLTPLLLKTLLFWHIIHRYYSSTRSV